MILLITNKLDTTADLVVWRAQQRQLPLVRLNTEDLPTTSWMVDPLASCVEFESPTSSFSARELTGVWYRRPLPPQYGDQFNLSDGEKRFLAEQWRDLVDALEILPHVRWVSRPGRIQRAENKALQLLWAQEAGFAVPHTCITNSLDGFRRIRRSGSVVLKALGSGLIDGEHSRFIFTTPLADDAPDPDAAELRASPVVVQRRLLVDRHLRLTVVGSRVLSAEISPFDGPQQLDWRTSREPPALRKCEIDDDVRTAAVKLVHGAGLAFSSMDVVLAQGQYYFLDLNPNGEWGWLERGAGLPIADALLDELQRSTEGEADVVGP